MALSPTGQSISGPWIGRSLPRREDAALITGHGVYASDVRPPDCLFAAFVRSHAATGIMRSCILDSAIEGTGVAAAFRGSDVAHLGALPVNPILARTEQQAYPILAAGAVSAVGQPVAAVLAEDPRQAADAAELVELDLGDTEGPPKTAITTTDLGVQDAPLAETWRQGDSESAFRSADVIVEAHIHHPRLAPSPLETRSIAVAYDPQNDRATVWLSTQTPHRARKDLAAILRVDKSRIDVIAPEVGGAFGMKASLYPEEVFCVWAAFRLKRSVVWTSSRGEDMLSATHGRGAVSTGRLALSRDGRFLALEADVVCPLGHWLPFSAAVPAWNAARILPGPYEIDNVSLSTRAVMTHTAPVGIYRGAGRPEAAALMERLVDKAARATGLDPTALRRANITASGNLPTQRATDAAIDSGDFSGLLDILTSSQRYEELFSNRESVRSAGGLYGVGLALYVEPCGSGWESATIKRNPDGTIEALTGSSTQGHGRATAYAQILADLFDIHPEQITVRVGDTRNCPPGIGALASRSTPIGGSALVAAAEAILARSAENGPIEETVSYTAPGEAWGSGITMAGVKIDPDTGVVVIDQLICVDDAGKIINPMLAEGQIMGGVAQGIGEALLEAVHYDEDGQLITGSLMDYALPRAEDVPPIAILKQSTPAPVNRLGAKGIGEAGTIGTPAAILNAVHDALSPFGTVEIDMPLTSEKIWRALHRTD